MPRVLHILPHPGGGGEVLVDMLAGLERYEHDRFCLSTSQSAVRGAASIAASRRAFRKRVEAADLLHVVGDMAATLAVRQLRQSPSVFGTHGLHFLRRARGLRGAVARHRLRAAVAAADRTICTSRAELDELTSLGGPGAERLRHISNGVRIPDLSAERRADARADLELRDDQVAVLYLGRLEARKDPMLAVVAVERAAAAGRPLVLLVAGDGPLAGEVARRSSAVVRPLGFRGDADRLLRAADVLVMPSSREGLSLAVLEAMAHGVPPVVSDGPGNPDAVGDAGVVFPAGNARALQDALMRLAGDDGERQRLGRAARERAEREFALDRFLADMDTIFEEVLARAPGRDGAAGRA